jgi:hypothetical protein
MQTDRSQMRRRRQQQQQQHKPAVAAPEAVVDPVDTMAWYRYYPWYVGVVAHSLSSCSDF